jgi:hypothetical protein
MVEAGRAALLRDALGLSVEVIVLPEIGFSVELVIGQDRSEKLSATSRVRHRIW